MPKQLMFWMKKVSFFFLLKNTSEPRKKLKLCLKKRQEIDKKVPKKSTQPAKTEILYRKNVFFTQKYLPAPQKTEIFDEKITKN